MRITVLTHRNRARRAGDQWTCHGGANQQWLLRPVE